MIRDLALRCWHCVCGLLVLLAIGAQASRAADVPGGVGAGRRGGFSVAATLPVSLADDLGYSDLGCYGGELHTPNIDKLGTAGCASRSFIMRRGVAQAGRHC